jgi:hypothetical protein
MRTGVLVIAADNEIRLECGQASLVLNKDGTIEIKGAKSVSADGAGATLGLAESGASLTGKNAVVHGKRVAEITGDTVKLN